MTYAAITPLLLSACGISRAAWRAHVWDDFRAAEEAAAEVRRGRWEEAMERQRSGA